jgi:hypothetical protein
MNGIPTIWTSRASAVFKYSPIEIFLNPWQTKGVK